jgi:hypothetical protein
VTRFACPLLLALALLVPAAAQEPEYLETPYTAEQMKKACTADRTITYKQTADGKSRTLTLRFEKPDDKGCVLVATATPEPGTEGEKEEEKDQATWEELRDHARFEKAKASRSEAKVTVPGGTFDCFVYVVTEDTIVTTLWFAKGHAGPPIKEEVKEGAKVIYLMELLKDERTAAPQATTEASTEKAPSTEKR